MAGRGRLSFACWLVFAIDFAVGTKFGDNFLGTWKGRVYPLIVVVTFPFYFAIPSLEEAALLACRPCRSRAEGGEQRHPPGGRFRL